MKAHLCSCFVLFLAGCGGAQEAKNLSRETLAQVVEYEEEVRTLSRDLQSVYRQSGGNYELIITRAGETSEFTIIANAANDAADAAIKDGYSDRALREFAANIVASNIAVSAELNSLRSQQAAAHRTAAASVSLDETQLQVLRAKLEQLQRDPSIAERAAQLRPLIEAAASALQTQVGNEGP